MTVFRVTLVVASLLLAGCSSTPHMASPTSDTMQRCEPMDERKVAELFERWNSALKSGSVEQVVQRYGEPSILLPTLSAQPRATRSEKADYFEHFLSNQPEGSIDQRWVEVDCNSAVDSGLYTFFLKKSREHVKARYTFTYKWNGQDWLISSHHSSIVPIDK